MTQAKHFKGSIHIFNFKNKRNSPIQTINFSLEAPLLSLSDTFMTNFKEFKFTQKEKHALTQQYREKIQYFKKLNTSELKEEADKLIKKLVPYQTDQIIVQASEMGAYICLVSIFSGKLPKNTNWKFELSSMPLKLFPLSFVRDKNAAQKRDIHFIFKENSWLKFFESLHQKPKYLNISPYKKKLHDKAA